MKRIAYILLYFLTIHTHLFLYAQEKIIHSSEDFGFVYQLSTFTDTSLSLGIQDIIRSKSFSVIDKEIPNFGISSNRHWIKTTITNQTNKDLFLEVAYPVFDYISFYKVVNDKIIDSVITGEQFAFSSRLNENKNFVFPLKLDSGQSATFYFSIKANKLSIFPLYVSDEQQIITRDSNNSIYNGIYFGIILVMILYNFFIFITVRDVSYAYYVVYIIFVGITQGVLNGYTFKYFWPEWTWMSQKSTTLFGALSGLATIYFVRNFLQTAQYSPRFDKLLTVFTIVYLVSLFATFWGSTLWAYQLINLNAGPGSFILLITAINIYAKHRNRTALFFIIAWSVFLLSVIVFVLKDYGVIPYNAFTISGLQIGSAFVVVMLSFALADKINTYRLEKEQAQMQALKSAKENERIIKEQNSLLEQKVEERTIELIASNHQLETALHDLKQTQTQMVEQEKMASLGQLTAGIAHEINNPINFVTSNVKPLKRDIDLIIEMNAKIAEIGSNGIDKAEKEHKINEIKKEYDYGYLLEEIDFLLRGIEEGSKRTAEIVKGLRIFSRVDEDDIKFADIHEGLDSTLIITNNLLNDKITVIKNYSEAPKIECYPGKLNQVFLNIISNGIYAVKQKFGDKSGGEITISTQKEDQFIIINLIDNGTGMTKETMHKIFEPFFTTKPVGEGTGLGMSIVYNTIAKHNGTIHVNSELGIGTTFTIKLPLKQS